MTAGLVINSGSKKTFVCDIARNKMVNEFSCVADNSHSESLALLYSIQSYLFGNQMSTFPEDDLVEFL